MRCWARWIRACLLRDESAHVYNSSLIFLYICFSLSRPCPCFLCFPSLLLKLCYLRSCSSLVCVSSLVLVLSCFVVVLSLLFPPLVSFLITISSYANVCPSRTQPTITFLPSYLHDHTSVRPLTLVPSSNRSPSTLLYSRHYSMELSFWIWIEYSIPLSFNLRPLTTDMPYVIRSPYSRWLVSSISLQLYVVYLC